MGLIDRLPLKATRHPKLHFNVPATRLTYGGIETRSIEKRDPVKGFGEVVEVKWTTTEDLTDVDGVVHPAGTEIVETMFVYSNDAKSQERAGSALFFVALALTGQKPAEDFNLIEAKDLVGRAVTSKITYSPGKDAPDNREKGFDNFRHTAIRA